MSITQMNWVFIRDKHHFNYDWVPNRWRAIKQYEDKKLNEYELRNIKDYQSDSPVLDKSPKEFLVEITKAIAPP